MYNSIVSTVIEATSSYFIVAKHGTHDVVSGLDVRCDIEATIVDIFIIYRLRGVHHVIANLATIRGLTWCQGNLLSVHVEIKCAKTADVSAG